MGGIGSKDVHIATTTAVGTAAAAALVTAAPGTAQQVERSGDFVKRDSGARLPSNVSDVTAKVKANQGLSNGGMSGNLSVLVDPAKAVREVANQLQRPEADKLVLSNVLGRGTWVRGAPIHAEYTEHTQACALMRTAVEDVSCQLMLSCAALQGGQLYAVSSPIHICPHVTWCGAAAGRGVPWNLAQPACRGEDVAAVRLPRRHTAAARHH